MLRKALILFVLPVVVYGAIILFVTYPLYTQLSTDVIGTQFTDSFESVRIGWWQAYALQHGQSPFYQSLFAYPDGFFSTTQWLQPLVYWPISLLNFFFNPVESFNLWILAILVLNGLAGYWVCLAIIDDGQRLPAVLAALLGGLIFMISQTAQGHLSVGHANFLSVFGLPPLAWSMVRAASGRSTRRSLLVGAVAVLILLLSDYAASVYVIFPLFLLFVLYMVVPPLIRRQPLPWKVLRQWAIIGVGGIVLSLPFYIPLVIESLSPQGSDFFNGGELVHYSTDLLAFATISPNTPWTKFADNPTNAWIINVDGVEGAAYLGLVAVVLAVIALIKERSKAKVWLFIALGAMILSLGPVLKWAGSPVTYSAADFSGTIVMPWALFQNLPIFNVARTPGRINFITMLCLGIMAALGLAYLLRHIKLPAPQILLALVLAIGSVAEYQEFFPFPTIPARLPQAFYDLAKRTDIQAVLDVPLNSLTGNKEALFEQTAHHKPLIAGYVVRGSPVSPDKVLLLSNVAMGTDYRVSDGQPLDPDTARAVLKANGADIIVYHWEYMDKTGTLKWAIQAFGQPLYQDDRTAIFEVPAPDKPAEASAIAYNGDGWQPSGAAPWLGTHSSLIVYTSAAQDRQWSLKVSPLLTPRKVSMSLDGQYQRTITLTPPYQQLNFWLRLSAGYHRLEFTFPDGCTSTPAVLACTGNASCAVNKASIPPDQEICVTAEMSNISVVDAGAMRYQAHVVHLGQNMSLQGFRLPSAVKVNDGLTLETDWQTQQKLDGDYHYFVHVLGKDGTVAAQFDAVPDGGQFPTSKWAAQQTWQELDSISLKAQPGTYSVYVGWYRYPDLQRLSVEGTAPQAADGLVYLGDIQVGE